MLDLFYLVFAVVVVVALVVVVVYLSICLPASLKTKLFYETSSIFDFDNIKNTIKGPDNPTR